MHEKFDPELNARLTFDETDRVREVHHVAEHWLIREKSARPAAVKYLREIADVLSVPMGQLDFAHQPVSFYEPDERDTEYRLSEEKSFFDSTTEGFYQTHRNVPVWAAGVTVTLKGGPLRVVSAVDTSLDDVNAELPPDAVIERWRRLFRESTPIQKSQGLAEEEPEPETSRFISDLLAGRAFKRSKKPSEQAAGSRWISGRFFVYRYVPEDRLSSQEEGPKDDSPEPNLAGEKGSPGLQPPEPTMPLPPVDRRIRPGRDYLVAEVVFHFPTPQWGDINWRALVELETGSILYLRGLSAAVDGLVFVGDPITESGNAANGPDQSNATLNPFRDDVSLPNLNAPVAGQQLLAGSRVTISNKTDPAIAAPTQATGSDFDYQVRTDDFAAVNAYFHVERFFQLVEDLGFPLSAYFDGTTFPVVVDHRGLGGVINAHCPGTGTGIDHLCYALAHTGDTANPIGIALDWRVHLHELGGHGILHDHVGGPNFGFSHSAGDSFAVIQGDPDSQAPDRFLLLPFVPAVVRRHDRPVSTWAWGGPNDDGGYGSEQILSTTLFRAYRSIGGDAADLNRRRFASRYMLYLILRTVATLTPATNPATPLAFANSMIATDDLNWTSEGIFGGAYGKVIRWAFEKQGLFQPGSPAAGTVTTTGQPPSVDTYIDDGRAGEYGYQPVHWHTTTIWNRQAADGGTTHQEPILGATNFAYVKVKNRGAQTANNVIVRGFHTKPMAGLLWPDDFAPLTTPQLSAGTLAANNGEEKVVGPFEWTPNLNAYGHDCMLMVVSATNDPSNVDKFIPGEVIPEWRLVPNDNNVGQRNVFPVPGAGGGGGLMEGLHGFPFWVGNPNPEQALIELRVSLPRFLVERGWRLGFEGLRGGRFTLASREKRQLTLDLTPGASFDRADVEAADQRDISIEALADGSLIGGMTYRVDPAIERPANPLGGKPCKGGDEICKVHAAKLLECLHLHGQDVEKVRLKNVTIDVQMKGDCT